MYSLHRNCLEEVTLNWLSALVLAQGKTEWACKLRTIATAGASSGTTVSDIATTIAVASAATITLTIMNDQ
jgi:hypothetical protein